MPKPPPSLSAALDKVYSAFAEYPRPTYMHGSPYKDVAGMFRALTSKPLRELGRDELGPYAGSALYTVGELDDYKHFLPRICELAASVQAAVGFDPPNIAQRLKYADWDSWPAQERSAMLSFFEAGFANARERHPNEGLDPEDWIIALASLGEDVAPMLAAWLESGSVESVLNAARSAGGVNGLMSDLPDELAYWSYVTPAVRAQICAWLLGPIAERLPAALEAVEAEDRWMLDRAIQSIRAFRMH